MEIELPGLAVLFGPNASGKSNFLDALQLLSRLATSRTLREAFAPPYRGKPLESFSFGHDGLRGLLDRKRLHLSIEADIELSEAVVGAVNREIQQMDGTAPRPAGSDAARERTPRTSVRHRNLRYRIDIEMAPRSSELRLHDEYLGALTRVSGHYEPWLWDCTQCGGGSWLCGPRSERRGSSANSDFHIRGVSSMARLAGCMLVRWSTSTR